jgi:hypothetical protein
VNAVSLTSGNIDPLLGFHITRTINKHILILSPHINGRRDIT